MDSKGRALFDQGKLATDRDDRRHCVRASYRECYSSLRTDAEATEYRAKVARTIAIVFLIGGFVATAATIYTIRTAIQRLDQLSTRY